SRGTPSPEKAGDCFWGTRPISFEQNHPDWSARVRACGGPHGGCSLENHFEIDSGLGEAFRLFVSLRSRLHIARLEAHDIMPVPRRGDEQGLNFFLKAARLQAKLVHIAHLRLGGSKFEDFARKRVSVHAVISSAEDEPGV